MAELDKKMTKEQFLKEQARVKQEYDILIDNPKSLALFLKNENGPSSSTKLKTKKHKTKQPVDKLVDKSVTESVDKRHKHDHRHHRHNHKHNNSHKRNHDHSHKQKQDRSDQKKNNIKKIIEADSDSLIIEQPKLMIDIGRDHHHLKIGQKSINLKKIEIGNYLSYIEKYSKDKNEYKQACKIVADFLNKESQKFRQLAE